MTNEQINKAVSEDLFNAVVSGKISFDEAFAIAKQRAANEAAIESEAENDGAALRQHKGLRGKRRNRKPQTRPINAIGAQHNVWMGRKLLSQIETAK